MITAFIILAEPETLQYPYIESIRSLARLCDRIIINFAAGKTSNVRQLESISLDKIKKIKDELIECKIDIVLDEFWPNQEKIQYNDLRNRFQNGLNMCSEGWFLRFDADNIFYATSILDIKKKLDSCKSYSHIVYFPRIDVINKDTFHVNRGSRDLYALNIDLLLKDNIDYEIADKSKWCGIKFDKNIIETTIEDEKMMPVNYDATFFDKNRLIDFWKKTLILYKNAEMTKESFENLTDDQVVLNYKKYIFKKRTNPYRVTKHPEDVTERVNSLTPSQWGYDNFKEIK
jgi:hypothetical protein